MTLDKYRGVVGEDVINRISELAQPLKGKNFAIVNSTDKGGGVAALLHSLLPMFNEVGMETEWLVLKVPEGDQFFTSTKGMHNTLQGKQVDDEEFNMIMEDYSDFYKNRDSFHENNKHFFE